MASTYPGSLDSLPTNHAEEQIVEDEDINDLADAINKIEAELGTTPSEGFATVKARLADIETLLEDVEELITGFDGGDFLETAFEQASEYADSPPEPNVVTGTEYTPVVADAGHVIVEFTNNSEVLVTLPELGFANNAQIEFCALGVAGAQFEDDGSSTIASAGGLVQLPQNCTAIARHRGDGDWLLSGSLA